MWHKFISLKNQLLSHQGFIKYASNISWLMAEKILRMSIGLFVSVWITRYLGPEQYGLFSYAQSIAFFLIAFSAFGLDTIVVRELVKNTAQAEIILGTAFILKLAMSIIAILGFCLFWLISNDVNQANLLIFIISLSTLFQSFNVIDFFYQSIVKSKYVAWANSITLLLSSIIKIALILNQGSLLSFVWLSVFDAIILAIGLIYFYQIQGKKNILKWQFDFLKAKELLHSSMPIMLASFMFVAYSRIDQIMINHLLGYKAVGYFSAGLRLVEVGYFIPSMLANSFFPAILNAKEHSSDLYLSRMRQLVLICLLPCLFLCVFCTIFSDWIIGLLYGQSFFETANIFQLQIWLIMLTSVGYINGLWFVSEKLEWLLVINYGLAVLANIICNYFFIAKYGIIGAVYASIFSQLVVYYAVLWLNKQTRFLPKKVYTLSVFRGWR